MSGIKPSTAPWVVSLLQLKLQYARAFFTPRIKSQENLIIHVNEHCESSKRYDMLIGNLLRFS
jgi:hypothetical protein